MSLACAPEVVTAAYVAEKMKLNYQGSYRSRFIDSGVDTDPIIVFMQSVIPLNAFTDTNDYDLVLDIQIEMINNLIKILNNNLLEIHDKKVIIKNAKHNKTVFPLILACESFKTLN